MKFPFALKLTFNCFISLSWLFLTATFAYLSPPSVLIKVTANELRENLEPKMLLLRNLHSKFFALLERANISRQFVIPSFPSLHFKFRYKTFARTFVRSKACESQSPEKAEIFIRIQQKKKENRCCDKAILIANIENNSCRGNEIKREKDKKRRKVWRHSTYNYNYLFLLFIAEAETLRSHKKPRRRVGKCCELCRKHLSLAREMFLPSQRQKNKIIWEGEKFSCLT